MLGGEVVLPQLADRPLPLTYPLTRSLWCSFLCFGFSFSASLGMWGMQGDRYVFMFLLIIFYRKFPHSLSLSLSLPVALCPLFLALPTAAALDFSFRFVLCFFSFSLAFPWAILQAEKFQKFFKIFSITFSSSSYPYRRFLTSNLRVGLVSVFFSRGSSVSLES